MFDEVHQLLSSSPEMSTISPLENEVNVMTQDDLDLLRSTCSFPDGIQIRIPDEGETILSDHPGEVSFYKAAFHA